MKKQRYLVQPDEVIISREPDGVVVQYKEPGVPTTHLAGATIAAMSDAEIVTYFNAMLREQANAAANYKHVAVEVPVGSPQLQRFGDQWVPRGGVLRCEVLDGEDGQPVVAVDDHELTVEEFGRMLATYAGWGMRIEFTPDDCIHFRPTLEVREPDPKQFRP